ncbi:MAG: hypothetical protein R3B13_39085 [Polyangiaceae bacterium]
MHDFGQIYGVSLTPLDRALSLRSLLLGLVLTGVGVMVVVLTDEAGSGLPQRAARMAVLLPAFSAAAALLAVLQMSRRGELRALAALGVPRARAVRGAVVGGWLLALLGVGLLAWPRAATASLFPVPPRGAAFELREDGALVEPSQGVAVTPQGEVAFLQTATTPEGSPPPRWAALLAVASLGIAAPLWAAHARRVRTAGMVAAVTAVLSVVLFHAVGAGRSPPVLLALCGVPLLMDAFRSRA